MLTTNETNEMTSMASRARAFTVSQCPHSEVGQDFLLRRRAPLVNRIEQLADRIGRNSSRLHPPCQWPPLCLSPQ